LEYCILSDEVAIDNLMLIPLIPALVENIWEIA
jgi:hypothetical protein